MRYYRILIIYACCLLATGCVSSSEIRVEDGPISTPTSMSAIGVQSELTIVSGEAPASAVPMGREILIQHVSWGGDGMDFREMYLGRGAPDFVLYTDGQLIRKEGTGYQEGYKFVEIMLGVSDMCALLEEIEGADFFEYEGDLYEQIDWSQYGDGAGNSIIQVNGTPSRQIEVESILEDYMVEEVGAVYSLLEDYRPSGMTPYYPERLSLWIEQGAGAAGWWGDPVYQEWPSELPTLSSLLGDRSEGEIVVEGELILPILQLFEHRMIGQVFVDGGRDYYVIARPLLPHETRIEHPVFDFSESSFELPFSCGD
jgi:hypothetical protein